MGQKTLINGTAYDLKSGKCLVGGTAYAIQKGRTLINGTGYDISLKSGTQMSEIPVGNTIKIAVDGELRDWIVVNQGIPGGSTLYDDSCDGTWLLMKDIYTQERLSLVQNYCSYASCNINSYLEGTFAPLIDENVLSIVKTVKVPYYWVAGWNTGFSTGENGAACRVFILSAYEVGYTNSDYGNIPTDGAKLDYFVSGSAGNANRRGYYNGSIISWMLRTPEANPMSNNSITVSGGWGAGYTHLNGSYASASMTNTYGVRPAMILPSETLVADDSTIIGL